MAINRLLIVEDEPTILHNLRKALSSIAREVFTSIAFEQALLCVELLRPDVILTDIRLSENSEDEGLEILDHVKRVLPDSRVYIMTGYGNPDTAASCFQRGASGYFEKPVDLNLLRLVLSDTSVEVQSLGAPACHNPNDRSLL